MYLINDNILVTELKKDTEVEGIVMMQDTASSPYMFCKVVEISKEARDAIYPDNYLERDVEDSILVIRRTAKESFVNNKFFISWKDVRGFMSTEEFNKL